jgi:hypothetical protein
MLRVRVVDVAVDDVGADRVAVEDPAPAIGPAAQLGERHLVVETEGLGRGQAGGAGGDVGEERRVECVGAVVGGWRHRGGFRGARRHDHHR